MFPSASPQGTWGPRGNKTHCFPRGQSLSVWLYLLTQNSTIHRCKFLEAFVQILLFAEVSQRSHGIVGRLVSRFGAFIVLKLLNFFFSSCLKPFSCHDCVKIICLTRLANKFAAVSKVHDLITCESKVQVVGSQGSNEVLFSLGRHEVLTMWYVNSSPPIRKRIWVGRCNNAISC